MVKAFLIVESKTHHTPLARDFSINAGIDPIGHQSQQRGIALILLEENLQKLAIEGEVNQPPIMVKRTPHFLENNPLVTSFFRHHGRIAWRSPRGVGIGEGAAVERIGAIGERLTPEPELSIKGARRRPKVIELGHEHPHRQVLPGRGEVIGHNRGRHRLP